MRKTSKKPRSKRAADIAILSITFAIIILLQLFAALLQKIGMAMSLALGLIPVLVVSQTHGIKYGAISGGFFGLITLLFSVIYASAIPIYSVTINPLVSMFPRIMVGVVCALSYGGFMRVAKNKNTNPSLRKYRATLIGISTVSTILGVLTNTILYLLMFFAFAHGKSFDGLVIDMKWILTSIVALNTVIELFLFAFVVPSIVYAMTQSRLATKIHLQPLNRNSMCAEETVGCENETKDDAIELNDGEMTDIFGHTYNNDDNSN